jgi:S-adenosylmethionine hydrolase
VAPDNGVLSHIIHSFPNEPLPDSDRVRLGPELKAWAITRSEYWLKPVSRTFHGRDIFAPVAARLSLGLMASSLGDSIDTLTTFAPSRPLIQNGVITGHILHIDSFGNLITDIQEADLSDPGQNINIIVNDYSIRGIVPNYAAGKGPAALFGSSGYLEIAVAGGSAAEYFRSRPGDTLKVKSAASE